MCLDLPLPFEPILYGPGPPKTLPKPPPSQKPPKYPKNAISWIFLDFNTSLMFHRDTKGLALLCVPHLPHSRGPLALQAP